MNKPRFTLITAMILAAATSRLVPHPPNFTPIAAMALFGGACFSRKSIAFLVPLAGLFLSDVVIGFYAITPIVYGAFALTVCLGLWVRRSSTARTAFAAIASSILFFVLTNFGVWAIDNLYPKTTAGLFECYVAAIPFFRNMLLGTLVYSVILFGGTALAERRFFKLSEPAALPS